MLRNSAAFGGSRPRIALLRFQYDRSGLRTIPWEHTKHQPFIWNPPLVVPGQFDDAAEEDVCSPEDEQDEQPFLDQSLIRPGQFDNAPEKHVSVPRQQGPNRGNRNEAKASAFGENDHVIVICETSGNRNETKASASAENDDVIVICETSGNGTKAEGSTPLNMQAINGSTLVNDYSTDIRAPGILGSLHIRNMPNDIQPLPRSRAHPARGRSVYRGVSRSGLLWRSAISYKSCTYDLGCYESERNAALMYAWARDVIRRENQKRSVSLSISPKPTMPEELPNLQLSKSKAFLPLLSRPDVSKCKEGEVPGLQVTRRNSSGSVTDSKLAPDEERKSPKKELVKRAAVKMRKASSKEQERKQSKIALSEVQGESSKSNQGHRTNTGKIVVRSELPLSKNRSSIQPDPDKATGLLTKLKHPSPLLIPGAGEVSDADRLAFIPTIQPDKTVRVLTRDFTNRDILWGRGTKTNYNAGNQWFRSIVIHYRPIYSTLRKLDKQKLAQNLVNYIRLQGGRFLEEATLPLLPYCEMVYVESGDYTATDKTKQALRDKKPNCNCWKDRLKRAPPTTLTSDSERSLKRLRLVLGKESKPKSHTGTELADRRECTTTLSHPILASSQGLNVGATQIETLYPMYCGSGYGSQANKDGTI